MRVLLPLLYCLLFVACSSEKSGDADGSSDSASIPQTSAPTGPAVRHFSITNEVMAVIDGAGCIFSAPGMARDSSLFASSSDAVIRVGERIQVLKFVGEGESSDSTSDLCFENAAYRVNLHTVTDSMIEGGNAQHGDMTVEDKRTGGKTMVALVGGCGC
jgi:hypothetical protein